MTSTTATTVRLDVTVDVPVQTAFRLFTEQFDQVKPREYNLLASPIEETVLEPRVGGHIYDRAADGTTCRWARILAFDPPERLVFTWDISPRWQLETDPERASEVEVRFLADGADRTRVELEHRHLDRHGEGWEGYAAGMASPSAWPLFLSRFEALTTEPPA
ncbi:SRPBCC family protein [Phycicoccus ginsengisoli]